MLLIHWSSVNRRPLSSEVNASLVHFSAYLVMNSSTASLICAIALAYFIFAALKELHEVRRRSAALQMQQFVGEEKNDLLDYLRSLLPEKVFRIVLLVESDHV